jgi:hypothetical protein
MASPKAIPGGEAAAKRPADARSFSPGAMGPINFFPRANPPSPAPPARCRRSGRSHLVIPSAAGFRRSRRIPDAALARAEFAPAGARTCAHSKVDRAVILPAAFIAETIVARPARAHKDEQFIHEQNWQKT